IQIVPAALRLEAFQVEVQAVEVEERDVTRCQPSLVRRTVVVATRNAHGLHGLDLRIPVENYLILLQISGARLPCGVGWQDRGDGTELPEGVTKLGVDAVDLF